MKISTILATALTAAGTVVAAPTACMDNCGQVEPKAPGINDPAFIDAVMRAHWYWRRPHCAQDLKWDPKLAKDAQESVNRCSHPRLRHDRGGSNLSGVDPAPEDYKGWIAFTHGAIHGWHDEMGKYPWDNPHYEDAYGHFTQLVWRASSRVGCAIAHCDGNQAGRIYCFYEEAGNNVSPGEFQKNIFPLVCPRPN
ncbi:PR-1-like protein [Zopfia rhizophila CBS 207.26]|uniref:PR-1-like protein n=1 Tax=Zopfia rhizophila CBS 207.26 TaxID=1314779 RepID=A0A6A6DTE5_9PEZI|nr:PR-1-like protein [Zopfia rhizophila CBS 207.26]